MAITESPTPESVAEKIGKEYVEKDTLPHENSLHARTQYKNIGRICLNLEEDIPVPVVYQSDDPYEDYKDMAETVAKEQQLRVYNQHTDHPYFSHKEQLAFRAVHDWYGHLSADVDFSPKGEYQKYRHMRKYFTHQENSVMFAEVVGQVGAIYYLSDGFADERYEQRAFLAPDRWMDWMYQAMF